MRRSEHHGYGKLMLLWFMLCIPSQSQAQVQKKAADPNIAKAEKLVDAIMARRTNLPQRWAVLQRREEVNSGDSKNGNLSEAWVEEFCAYDAKTQTMVRHVNQHDRGFQKGLRIEGWASSARSWSTPGLILYKSNKEDWKYVPKLPKGYLSGSDPFSWYVAFMASVKFGDLQEGHAARLTREDGRQCVHAKYVANQLVGIWGKSGEAEKLKRGYARPAVAYRLAFDPATQLPVEFSLLEFKNGLTTEAIEIQDFILGEKGRVEWKTYVTQDGQRVTVPSVVRVLSTWNPREELECVNKLYWLFDDDVPDGVFDEPRGREPVEPAFAEAATKP